MKIDGARVYIEGIENGLDYQKKIRQIIRVVKSLSPSSDLSFRLLKSGKIYEGLMWGKVSGIPVGLYNQGPSMTHVLDTLYRKAKKESFKIWKLKGGDLPKRNNYTDGHSQLAMLG